MDAACALAAAVLPETSASVYGTPSVFMAETLAGVTEKSTLAVARNG